MSVLYGTFGRDLTCVKRFLTRYKDKPHALQIHFSNETCREPHRKCFRSELFPTDSSAAIDLRLRRLRPATIRTIHKRMERLRANFEPLLHPKTRLIIGVALEDRLSTKAYENLLGELDWIWTPRDRFKSRLFYSRNPKGFYERDISYADFIELHGMFPNFSYYSRNCIYNSDGDELNAPNRNFAIRAYQNCMYLLFWTKGGQGIGGDEGFIPPFLRTFRISAREVREYKQALRLRNQ